MEHNVEAAISRFRQRISDLQPAHDSPPAGSLATAFVNPGPDTPVAAEDFFHHTNLDDPDVVSVLQTCYPNLDRNRGLRSQVFAMIRFLAWMVAKGFNSLLRAHNALSVDVEAQQKLGFAEMPSYETFRDFFHDRLLKAGRFDDLLSALLKTQVRLLPTLGQRQVEDALPLVARRNDPEAAYSGYHKAKVYPVEARWDPQHEALLDQQCYPDLGHEGHRLVGFTHRVQAAGIARAESVTVDNGYTSLENIARQWHAGQPLQHRSLAEWHVDAQAAEKDVGKRYQTYWKHPLFLTDAPLDARLRFLVEHGSPQDVEAVGRCLRDRTVEARVRAVTLPDTPSPRDEAERAAREWAKEDALHTVETALVPERSLNEGLNAELQRVIPRPKWRGVVEMLRRAGAGFLAMHLVQLTRLQSGITRGLCRMTHIL